MLVRGRDVLVAGRGRLGERLVRWQRQVTGKVKDGVVMGNVKTKQEEVIKVVSDEKGVRVKIRITASNSSARRKRRKCVTEHGISVFVKKTELSLDDYIEWQIGYYKTSNSKGASGGKIPHELFDIIREAYAKGLISKQDIKERYEKINGFSTEDILQGFEEKDIHRRCSKSMVLTNGFEFHQMETCYQMIRHKFKKSDVSVEIMCRERGRAAGVQPMLYVCLPFKVLKFKKSPTNRYAEANERADWIIQRKEALILLDVTVLLGMLSISHKEDLVSILKNVLEKEGGE